MPATPQPDKDDAHQQLLDQMDIYYLQKPFRNPEWKPTHRRNKNIKQILSEAQRREASVLATQNNSGASTPLPQPSDISGASTPQPNMAQATQSLSTLVLERNLQRAVNMNSILGPQASLGPAVTYTNIESAPSFHAAKKHYCDITGLPSKYTDPKTKLRYYNQEIFGVRIKGAIDSRIAEEQARQAKQQQQVTRQTPRRRPGTQNGGASKAVLRQRDAPSTPGEKGTNPDPSEFEPEFAIGTDESATPSRVATPRPESIRNAATKESSENPPPSQDDSPQLEKKETISEEKQDELGPVTPQELPTDVKVKIRKLERLESKYGELLRAYRTAHSRVQVIEPFEATLRENTPLTSISDPAALTEYLNQLNLKGDMVLEELKRVSMDRDQYKKKFEDSEKQASDLQSEVEQQKKKLQELATTATADDENPALPESENRTVPPTKASNTPSLTSSISHVPSISVFSPKAKPTVEPQEKSEDLFSYDEEVPKLEAEIQERQLEVEHLTRQVASLKGDLKVARESTEGMVQTLENTTRELNTLRDVREKLEITKSDLEKKILTLEQRTSSDEENAQSKAENAILQEEKDSALLQVQQLQEKIQSLEQMQHKLEAELQTVKNQAEIFNEKLGQKDHVVKDLEDSLAMAKVSERDHIKQAEKDKSTEKRLETMQGIMDSLRDQLSRAERTVAELKHKLQSQEAEFTNRPSSKIFGILDEDETLASRMERLQSRDDIVDFLSETLVQSKTKSQNDSIVSAKPADDSAIATSKKKNKKKKKGKAGPSAAEEAEIDGPVKVSEDLSQEDGRNALISSEPSAKILELESEILKLKNELQDREAAVDRLFKQIKDQEALREEIETLKDDLLHQGEEHVEARDALKTAQSERQALSQTVNKLESELVKAKAQLATAAGVAKIRDELAEEVETLRSKSSGLETDFAASEQLAAARFKDIADLRELLNKAQPELRSLRKEVEELKSAKEDLKNKKGELSRLESKHEEVKDEMKNLGKRIGDQDATIKDLQQKVEQESKMRLKVENDLSASQSELKDTEARVKAANDASEETAKEFAKMKEERSTLRAKLRELEDQLATQNRQISTLKEELSLKTALHSSSQSLVQSLRDQVHEINVQAREGTLRAENLEEELAEAQRMLSERTREGQTMRMLLNQSETGTEGRLREMKERMDVALEERDRIEDEANVNSRRMMREVEDAKSKARDAQRQLKILEDEKDELENKNKEWKRRREELEKTTESSKREVEDIRSAMKGLREALDESERQARDAEAHRSDLKRQTDEATERIEKLSKANKNLTEEVKSLQAQTGLRKTSVRPGMDSGRQSSRTSIDSSTPRSPAPTSRTPISTIRTDTPPATGLSQGTVDYVYLKNVLLQFLTQKDKGHQRQLIPVLAMLLHFDQKDEQKWNAAISTR